MSYKNLMITTLTNLLEKGETLMHPIYGILRQGNEQYYGYFGLTENYLLIALINPWNGKQITHTTRVPLDVRSVKMKRTAVFRQLVIDIGFYDGAPCTIIASQKVARIDTQQHNLPLFLQYLEAKAPHSATPLRDVCGEKIRWQYFNVPLYVILVSFFMAIILVAIIGFLDDHLTFFKH